MAAPTPVQHAEAASWTSVAGTQTITITGQAADQIVVCACTADAGGSFTTPTNDNAALTWAQKQLVGTAGQSTKSAIWTTTLDTSRTVVITVNHTTGTQWGAFSDVFRGSDGIGATAAGTIGDTTNPWSAAITTTQDNSALVVLNGDWAAVVGGRTWLTSGVGTFTEETAINSPTQYSVNGGYYADVGTAGAKTVGVSGPAAQQTMLVVVEVKGSGGVAAPAVWLPRRMPLGV